MSNHCCCSFSIYILVLLHFLFTVHKMLNRKNLLQNHHHQNQPPSPNHLHHQSRVNQNRNQRRGNMKKRRRRRKRRNLKNKMMQRKTKQRDQVVQNRPNSLEIIVSVIARMTIEIELIELYRTWTTEVKKVQKACFSIDSSQLVQPKQLMKISAPQSKKTVCAFQITCKLLSFTLEDT